MYKILLNKSKVYKIFFWTYDIHTIGVAGGALDPSRKIYLACQNKNGSFAGQKLEAMQKIICNLPVFLLVSEKSSKRSETEKIKVATQ